MLLALLPWLPLLLSAACSRVERPPVAPFGGELAAPLPSRDVIGLVRFLPGDERVAPLLEQLALGPGGKPLASSIAAPAATVLAMLEQTRFVPADQPFAVVLLDASVHGALAGFAWRGDAAAFRKAARERGLALPEEDHVELPGRGRVEGFEVLSDLQQQTIPGRPAPHVDYHLVERDGVTLLLPARDGARNVLAALERTHALDPLVGDFCLRFELGPAVEEVRDVARQLLLMPVNGAIDRVMGDPRLELRDERRENAWYDQWRVQWMLRDVVDAMLDLATSIEHMMVHVDEDRAEIYLRANDDGFFRRLLPMARNLPLAELLAGAPADADFVAAAACDPKLLAGIEGTWEASRQGLFRRERRHRLRDMELVEEGELEPPFLDSFGGRLWVALASGPDEGAHTPEAALLKSLGAGSVPAPSFTARIFAELKDEATNLGPVTALAKATLPKTWFESVRAASLAFYAVSRVPNGCVEVIGGSANRRVAAERRRLEGGSAPIAIPADALPEAFFCVFAPDVGGSLPAALTAARDGDGIRLRISLPPR